MRKCNKNCEFFTQDDDGIGYCDYVIDPIESSKPIYAKQPEIKEGDDCYYKFE